LRKERFPEERKSKLMPRVDGPFQIIRKISDNAYQLDLKGNYDISSSFNVSDLSPFLVDVPDLWTNPLKGGGNDAPQIMEQFVGQVQHEDQNSPRYSTEVHPDDRTERTDRAVYRIDPRTSGMELRLDPRPDDRSDRTEARLPRPTRQVRKIDQAKLSSERTDFESDRSFSFLTRLALTAGTAERTAERSENPTYQFDPILQFDHLSFSRGRILKLSEDIGHIWNTSVHEFPSSDHADRPDHVLLLTAGHASRFIESGQE